MDAKLTEAEMIAKIKEQFTFCTEEFDASKAYFEGVKPLLEAAMQICTQHKIPFITMAVLKVDKHGFEADVNQIGLTAAERCPPTFIAARAYMSGLQEGDSFVQRLQMAGQAGYLTIGNKSGHAVFAQAPEPARILVLSQGNHPTRKS